MRDAARNRRGFIRAREAKPWISAESVRRAARWIQPTAFARREAASSGPSPPSILGRHPHQRKRRREMRAPLEVVKSDDGDISRTLLLGVAYCAEQSQCHQIVAHYNGSGWRNLLEQFQAAPVTGILRVARRTGSDYGQDRHAGRAELSCILRRSAPLSKPSGSLRIATLTN